MIQFKKKQRQLILSYLLLIISSFVYGKTNFIVILCDDLGNGDVGFQNNNEVITPNLDSLANDGVILKQFYAAGPVCSPTRASILTGRHYIRTGVLDDNVGRLRAREHTLATALSKHAEYSCSMTGKWHLGALSVEQRSDFILDSRPWWHGFNHTFVTHNTVSSWNPFGVNGASAATTSNPYYSHGDRVTSNMVGDDSAIIMDRAIPFITEQVKLGRSFASFIWFHTPHLPCVAGLKYLNMYKSLPAKKRHFYGSITAMDEQVGRLYSTLTQLGVERDTLIWFSSSSGPESVSNQYLGSTLGLRGKKRSLYNGGVTVPSFVHWPGTITPRTVVDAPLSSLDIYPTLLNIAMHESEQSTLYSKDVLSHHPEVSPLPLDGINAWDLLTRNITYREAMIPFSYHHSGTHTHAIISYPYKLLIDLHKKARLATSELYDLEKDRYEKHNLADQMVELTANLTRALEDWSNGVKASFHGFDYVMSSHNMNRTVNFEENDKGRNESFFQPDFSWSKVMSCGRKEILKCIDPVVSHKVLQEDKLISMREVTNVALKINSSDALVAYVRDHFRYNRGAENRYMHLSFITKNASHSRSRVVFLAGIGGVGHHLFHEVLSNANFAGCNHTCVEVSVADREYFWMLHGKGTPLFTSSTQEAVVSGAKNVIAIYKRHESAREATLYLNVMGQIGGSGMMSYPNFATRQNSFEPNVHILAFLAELSSVDFRVMVLLRDPVMALKSLWRRFGAHFNSNKVTPERFATQQDYLLRQLQGLDSSFFSCVRYENVTSDAFVVDREILSTGGNYSLGEAVIRVYKKPSSSQNTAKGPHQFKLNSKTIAWMQGTYKELLKLCNML